MRPILLVPSRELGVLVVWLGIYRPLGIVVPELQSDEGLALAGEALGTQPLLAPFPNGRL